MPIAGRVYFDGKLFAFLKDLAKNNRREWFHENKDRYGRDVRDPMLEFIADFGPKLEKISPAFLAGPRRAGGSLFRIHRDVRFSRDKSPYKTFAAAQFRHEAGKDAHAPCYYLHIDPKGSFLGAGIWRPDGNSLAKIWQAIADEPAAWKKAAGARAFRSRFSLGGDSLKRPPRGFDPEHPFIDDLKRKDFIATAPLAEEEIRSGDMLRLFAQRCRTAAPFVRFLTRALELPC